MMRILGVRSYGALYRLSMVHGWPPRTREQITAMQHGPKVASRWKKGFAKDSELVLPPILVCATGYASAVRCSGCGSDNVAPAGLCVNCGVSNERRSTLRKVR